MRTNKNASTNMQRLEGILAELGPKLTYKGSFDSSTVRAAMKDQEFNPKSSAIYVKTQESEKVNPDKRFVKHVKIPIRSKQEGPLTDRIIIRDYSRKGSAANLHQLKCKGQPINKTLEPLKTDRPTVMLGPMKNPGGPSLLQVIREKLRRILQKYQLHSPDLDSLVTYQQHFEYLLDLLKVTLQFQQQSLPIRQNMAVKSMIAKIHEDYRHQIQVLKETNRLLVNSEELISRKLQEAKEMYKQACKKIKVMQFGAQTEYGRRGGRTAREHVNRQFNSTFNLNQAFTRISSSASVSDLRQDSMVDGDTECLRVKLQEKNRLIKNLQSMIEDRQGEILRLKDKCRNLQKKCRQINQNKTLTTATYEQQLLNTIKQLSESQHSIPESERECQLGIQESLDHISENLTEAIQEVKNDNQRTNFKANSDLSKFKKKLEPILPAVIEVPRLHFKNEAQVPNDQTFFHFRQDIIFEPHSSSKTTSEDHPMLF